MKKTKFYNHFNHLNNLDEKGLIRIVANLMNKLEILTEDIESIEMHLDNLKVPRYNGGGEKYSLIRRIEKIFENEEELKRHVVKIRLNKNNI